MYSTRKGSSRRQIIAFAAVATTISVLASGLFGSAAVASTGSLLAQGGGVTPSKPRVVSAECSLDQGLSCFGESTLRPGQPLLIAGSNFSNDAEVVFRPAHTKLAKRSRGKGRIAKSSVKSVVAASSVSNSQIEAAVPKLKEGNYNVQVRNDSDLVSNPVQIKVLAEPKVKPGSTAKIIDAVTKFRRFYSGGKGQQAFIFQVSSLSPSVQATVELVDLTSKAVVRQWSFNAVTNRLSNVSWDGLLANGETAPEGRYQFRLHVAGVAEDHTSSNGMLAGKEVKGKASFSYQKYIFPIQGLYTVGRGLSAGHDGVDLMSKRGTPLVAVTSGKVEYVGSHARAGIYLILSGFDGKRYFYLHMNEKPPVKKGDSVYAGQRIGSVGITGNASAYHLHFEVRETVGSSKSSWNGSVLDPVKFLRSIK